MIVCPDGTVLDVATHPDPPAATIPGPARTEVPPLHSPYPDVPPLGEDWGDPLPDPFHVDYDRLRDAAGAGDLAEAIGIAYRLEQRLTDEFGASHPHTVNLLTVRSWLTVCRRTDPAETLSLLVLTAHRRWRAGAKPVEVTYRTAANAFVLWHQLADADPGSAPRWAGPVLDVMTLLGWGNRSQVVREWKAKHPVPTG
ncbi:hypothetical protein AMK16_33165 [Streptomyces sp. CB00455]|uniref:hypothetical protein n=1 Tax=Streptomyces sp. CB00455 TaxID=1703927 RepID=UPI00093BD045|nr:hypothetical protein [Streptomyces sp. CB00455]OKK10609.1 hypothetical protein AMK16_33165 [Streptomyces sp. CB00455]